MIYLWRTALTALALFLAWQVIVNGLAAHYVERYRAGDDSALEKLAVWQPEHPDVLIAEALAKLPGDKQEALRLLAAAYRANPTDPYPLTLATSVLTQEGEHDRADQLMEIAVKLAPATPWVLKDAAAYWDSRGEPRRALDLVSRALEADPGQRTDLFPVLIEVAGDPRTRGLLAPFAASPPSWWNGFFVKAARDTSDLDDLRYLYTLRRNSDEQPLTEEERAAYVARLQKEGRTGEAYVVWIGGLSAREQRQLGLLFNGDFELPLSQGGFGWHVRPSRHASIRPLATPGTTGSQALRVTFRAQEQRFHHLFQPLYLDPGSYRLSGRVRTDKLRTKGGLRWQLLCTAPKREPLTAGPPMLSYPTWDSFEIDFDVPAGCQAQQIRLTSAGRLPFELKLDGDIWFDRMRIVRTSAAPVATSGSASPEQGLAEN